MRYSFAIIPILAAVALAAPAQVAETVQTVDKRTLQGAINAVLAALGDLLSGNLAGALGELQTAIAELSSP